VENEADIEEVVRALEEAYRRSQNLTEVERRRKKPLSTLESVKPSNLNLDITLWMTSLSLS
jgi:hypothetical protein